MEVLYMKVNKAKREKSHSLIQVTPAVHTKVKDLSAKLDRLPIDVASELIEWALEHVEIVEDMED